MAPSKKQIVQSVVASITAVVPLVIQLFGLITIWGINMSRQKNSHYRCASKETKVF